MSLNRYESLLHDYIDSHPEELRYWKALVEEVGRRSLRREEKVLEINANLWDYFRERALSEKPFREVFEQHGETRISMLNLSEYLLRMWVPEPAPAKGRRGA